LGEVLLAQADFEKDDGFEISPDGPGSAFFTEGSTHGFYFHRK
jgi:hypothetical protein